MGQRVGIIGAGPAGAIALNAFLKVGFTDIVVFDRHRTVGGTWSLDKDVGFEPPEDVPGIERLGSELDPPVEIPDGAENSYKTSPIRLPHTDQGSRFDEANLYRQVETNVLAELMAFTNDPFPAIYPKSTKERFGVDDAFRTQDVVRDYVVNHFTGKEKYLKLETTVERAYQPQGVGSGWRLVLRSHRLGSDYDEWWSEYFDFLYAATGRFNVPNIPNIEGLKDAIKQSPRGTITHTKVFREPSDFTGKRVVLVGASFSNVDVAHLIHAAGAQTPIHLALLNILPTIIPHFAQPWIETHSKVKKVKYVPENQTLDVTFLDDVTLRDIDKLVLGTGYQYSYPYLQEYTEKYGGITNGNNRGTHNLYWSTWWKYDPTLAVSSNIVDAIFWRFIEAQAKATANLWQLNRDQWPTVEDAEAWENERRGAGHYDFHIWYPRFAELIGGIAKVGRVNLGPQPNYVYLFEKSIATKANHSAKKAQKSLAEHPEQIDRYEKTLEYLKDHQVVIK